MEGTWRHMLQDALMRAWLNRGLLARLLYPVSLLFRALARIRRELYARGILPVQRVNALVIVVGNVVVGGAGKTPTVIALVMHLRDQGYQVGVISRGYGRSTTESLEVANNSSPYDTGDEPLLIHNTTQVPVFVCSNRVKAATDLLQRYPLTQVIVCDDGLQHYALYRDLEVCVFDDRGYGNGWLLPAGPLREPWPRKPIMDCGQGSDSLVVLHTGARAAFDGFTGVRSLAAFARARDGTTTAVSALSGPGRKPVLAVAGIAVPESFFSMLRECQVHLDKTLALPDHYDFDSFLISDYKGYSIVCTEKDAAKLWLKAPSALAVPLVLVPESDFFFTIDARVNEMMSAKLSSTHGHKTT